MLVKTLDWITFVREYIDCLALCDVRLMASLPLPLPLPCLSPARSPGAAVRGVDEASRQGEAGQAAADRPRGRRQGQHPEVRRGGRRRGGPGTAAHSHLTLTPAGIVGDALDTQVTTCKHTRPKRHAPDARVTTQKHARTPWRYTSCTGYDIKTHTHA